MLYQRQDGCDDSLWLQVHIYIYIMPSLGPKVYSQDLLWAVWGPRDEPSGCGASYAPGDPVPELWPATAWLFPLMHFMAVALDWGVL